MAKYSEQFARMKRYLERFGEIHAGRVHDRDSEHYLDDVYSFFLNCYHLKDWLIHDPAFPANAAEVEGFINSNVGLQVCADICNAHKHLLLKHPRSAENPKMGPKKFFVGLGSGPTTVRANYTIDTASGPREAYELAERCAELWRSFIVGKGGAV